MTSPLCAAKYMAPSRCCRPLHRHQISTSSQSLRGDSSWSQHYNWLTHKRSRFLVGYKLDPRWASIPLAVVILVLLAVGIHFLDSVEHHAKQVLSLELPSCP